MQGSSRGTTTTTAHGAKEKPKRPPIVCPVTPATPAAIRTPLEQPTIDFRGGQAPYASPRPARGAHPVDVSTPPPEIGPPRPSAGHATSESQAHPAQQPPPPPPPPQQQQPYPHNGHHSPQPGAHAHAHPPQQHAPAPVAARVAGHSVDRGPTEQRGAAHAAAQAGAAMHGGPGGGGAAAFAGVPSPMVSGGAGVTGHRERAAAGGVAVGVGHQQPVGSPGGGARAWRGCTGVKRVRMSLKASATKVDRKDGPLGRSDPYLILEHLSWCDASGAGSNEVLHQTKPRRFTLNPTWDPFKVEFDCVDAVEMKQLKFTVMDKDWTNKDDEIGSVVATVGQLRSLPNLTLVNSKNQETGQSSGTLNIDSCSVDVYARVG